MKIKFHLQNLLVDESIVRRELCLVCVSYQALSWLKTKKVETRFNRITFAFSPFLLSAEKDSDNDLFDGDRSDSSSTFNSLVAPTERLRILSARRPKKILSVDTCKPFQNLVFANY